MTDVGNDILYGFSVDQVLAWVDEALTRLSRITDDVVLTDLPMDSIRRLSRPLFYAVRSVLVPSSRLSLEQVVTAAERVNSGLADLAQAHAATFFRLRPSWYGFDPIHIKPSLWRSAWQEIMGVSCPIERSWTEALGLYLRRPERQWLCGVEQRTRQVGLRLPRGACLWLY